jgi:hypothetical protein
MTISIKVKASLLADYVIICVGSSAMILGCSYIGLSSTTKPIPSDLTTMIISFTLSSVTAAGLKSKSRLDADISNKGSLVNTMLLGLATMKLALVIQYNLLVWAEKTIPEKYSTAITSLALILLTITNFQGSGYTKSNPSDLPEPEDIPTDLTLK